MKNKLKNYKYKGFSLMELMVVIAIVGIMTSIGLVYLGDNKIERQVEGAAREVAASIREAQNYALTGKKSDPAEQPCGSRWRADAGTPDYRIRPKTEDPTNGCIPAGTAYDILYYLKNGVLFRGDDNFDFLAPFGTIALNTGDGIIVIEKGSHCLNITMDINTGSVTEGKIDDGC